MKVRVKEGKIGFIYGKLRKGDIPGRKPDEFTLKPFKHPRKKDGKGKPLVISAKDQFSKNWMEEVKKGSSDIDEPKEPSEMKVNELKVALTEAEIEIPDGAKKEDLVILLEDHLLSED